MAHLLVTATDGEGNEGSVTVEIEKVGGPTPLVGDVSGVFGNAHIVGDLSLTGDVIISGGTLTGIDTFHVQGNGFSFFFENGGRAILHGKVKGHWGEWGSGGERSADTTGWVAGDRLGIVPTKVGNYIPLEGLWTDDWATVIRPAGAPNFTPVGRSTRGPEVVNLSQSIVFENLARGFHMHDSAGVQILSDVKFLNCGTVGVLGHYPVHFHQLYDNSRGSLLTRVVVEGGKNHAFVPHGSHGVTLLDCVAWNTINDAYWWDTPPTAPTGQPPSTVNDSHDANWEHCLAAGVLQTPGGSTDHRLTAFNIGAGNGNRCNRSVAACVRGTQAQPAGKNISGFQWRENFVWEFVGNCAHNIQKNGINTWSNSAHRHIIDDFVAYHFAYCGIEHGAYRTQFVYRNVSLTVTNPIFEPGSKDTQAIRQHSNSDYAGLLFENIVSDDRLVVDNHGLAGSGWTIHRNCQYTRVVYSETGGSGTDHPSKIRHEDGGLEPTDFQLGGGIHPASEIEIYESGLLVHRWAASAWS